MKIIITVKKVKYFKPDILFYLNSPKVIPLKGIFEKQILPWIQVKAIPPSTVALGSIRNNLQKLA